MLCGTTVAVVTMCTTRQGVIEGTVHCSGHGSCGNPCSVLSVLWCSVMNGAGCIVSSDLQLGLTIICGLVLPM
jgi:hypothetical protein